MRKRKSEPTEYAPVTDTGSYQTGAARPPKRNSGLVTALLIVIIFLGGLASAFGFLNFRLLAIVAQKGGSIQPLDTNTATVTTGTNAFIENNDDTPPEIPALRDVQIELNQLHEDMSPDALYSHNEQSLVSIYCTTHCNELLSGTGVVLSEDGYILTNAHIIDSHQRVFVYLPDGRLLRAAVVGSDPFTDLAVLYVEARDLVPAIFVDSETVAADDEIHALNNQPDADHNFLLSGKVYAVADISTGDLTLPLLSSSVWGDSGPMFDAQGRIVAIRTGKIRQYFGDDRRCQQGMAIPSQTVQQIVSQLIGQGYVPGRPTLQIQVEAISKLYQHYWSLPGGLLVTQVAEGSNAEAQGLQEGDILLTLEGNQLSSRADLYASVYSAQIGDELIAAVFRDGRIFTITLTVETNA